MGTTSALNFLGLKGNIKKTHEKLINKSTTLCLVHIFVYEKACLSLCVVRRHRPMPKRPPAASRQLVLVSGDGITVRTVQYSTVQRTSTVGFAVLRCAVQRSQLCATYYATVTTIIVHASRGLGGKNGRCGGGPFMQRNLPPPKSTFVPTVKYYSK